MDAQKKLKLIPLHHYFKVLDTPGKLLYILLFLGLAAAAVGFVIAAENPSQWIVSMEEFHHTLPEEVKLRDYHTQHRHMSTEITAWKERVMYFATPMVPQPWIVIAFVCAQILGWSFLLTSASYLRNFVSYVVYFLFAMTIFLSGAAEAILPGQYWLLNAGLAILIFAPAYLFQQGIFQWRFALRLPFFTAITALPFAVLYFTKGWLGLHGATVGMFPLLAFVALIYLIFSAKDISQLIFFATTNLPNPKYRARFPILLTIYLIVLGLEFVMLHELMGWDMIVMEDDFPLRPSYFIAFIALLVPALNQNIAYTLKGAIDNRGFSFLITAFALISLSVLFYHVALGEYLFLHAFERIAALLIFLATILHFFYMFYNFSPLIRARLNFYYISMMPKRLMFAFVLATLVLASLAIDASDGMKTQRLLKASSYNRAADQEMLLNNLEAAASLYDAAVYSAAGTVKGNYNRAMLLIKTDGDLEAVRNHLRDASRFVPFPPAWVNLGNLELEIGTTDQAKKFLRDGITLIPDPYIANNLAQTHLALGEADSAIMAMKAALRLAPESPNLYANIGYIYMLYDKPGPAKDFLSAGLALPDPGPALVTNALLYNMKYDTPIEVSDAQLQAPDIAQSRSTSFNFAVERYKKGDLAGASTILDTLLKASETPDALFLDGMIRFERGEVESAVSRMQYMDINYPEYTNYTHHFLGVAFFSAGVPEMAAEYFRHSVASGRTDDLLNEALMEIDRGDQEYGFIQLNMARQQDSTLFSAVAREEALLQISRGEYFFASIGFDLASLTPEEWIRAGIYAGKKGNIPAALEAFRRGLELDPKQVDPYLEMGRISIRLRDSLAAENLLPALKIDPNSLPVKIELARAELLRHDQKAAFAREAEVLKQAPKDFEVRRLQAEFNLLRGDTATALKQFEQLHKERPLHTDLTVQYAQTLRAQRRDFEGQNMLYQALEINPRNPDLWYEMAHFERLLVRPDQAGGAALKAIALQPDLEKGKQVAAEFKEEIQAYNELNQLEVD